MSRTISENMSFKTSAEVMQSMLRSEYGKIVEEDQFHKTFWRSPMDGPHPWLSYKSTDVNQHGPNFKYLVHGVRPLDSVSPSGLIDFFYQRPAISMSLINSDCLETFYNIGFILDVPVPSENIVAALPSGLAGAMLSGKSTEAEYLAAIAEANSISGVLSPEDILKYFPITRGSTTEIYAITGYKYSNVPKIRIVGVFLNKERNKILKSIVQEWSSILNVPVIDFRK